MKKIIFVLVLCISAFTSVAGDPNLNKIYANYNSYREAAQRWLQEEMLHDFLAGQLVIELPSDRTRYGTLTFGRQGVFEEWEYAYKPIRCLGRNITGNYITFDTTTGGTIFKENYAPQSIPVGNYYGFALDKSIAKLALPTLSSDDLLHEGIIVLIPDDIGDKSGYIIHATNSKNNHILPSRAGVSVSKADMGALINRIHALHADIMLQSEDTALAGRFVALSAWLQYDAYRSFIKVKVVEGRNANSSMFGTKGPKISEDTLIQSTLGYTHPLAISNYSMASEYYKAKTISISLALFNIQNELDNILVALEQFDARVITKAVCITQIKGSLDAMEACKSQLNASQLISGNAGWEGYFKGLWDYVAHMRTFVRDWETNATRGPGNARCFMIDSQCNVFVLMCKYKCETGQVYSEICGGCIGLPF